jgi:DNA-binding response OmpR family regulator
MDLKMPKLNGLDAAKRIRELEHFAKIIFISGSTLHTPAEELADAFLTKPLRGRDLLNAVRRVLRQTNLQGPLANGL